MKTRKTVEIETLLRQGNAYLAAPHTTEQNRVGAYVLLEGALHAANRYKGWGLLVIPGKQFFSTVKDNEFPNGRWIISDESRRFYY